ncbi:MAG TPA: AIM24 family protein [Thermoanaerobaculia bacterium]|nr:AIM24 family protein [Thermoanaerobaculia bacterium]
MSRVPGSLPPLDRGIFFVHISRARKHLAEERFDLARKELELADLAKPNDEEVLNLLSVVEFKRGYYNEAAQAARQLLAANTHSAVLHCNLGLILFKAGVLGEAEQELRRAIELKPDHARSHLYLGLLYRMRGKLGLAVEHLKFAGAQRVVGEIEESLRRLPREYPGRAQATAPTSPRPAAPRPVPVPVPVEPAPAVAQPPVAVAPPAEPEKPAVITAPQPVADAEETNPNFRPGEGPAPSAPEEITERIHVSPLPSPPVPVVSPVTEPSLPPGAPLDATLSRETAPDPRPGASPRDTGGRPLFHVRPDGGLEVASRGVVFVRKGSVVWYSGKIRFSAEPSFRGTRLEKILRADGRGYLFVNDPGRAAFRRDLAGQSLYLEGSRLLALDHGLSFRLEPIHDFRMNRRVDILKIQGRGSVVLSVGGPLLAHEVTAEFPLNVSSRDLVAWTGDVVPSVLEDRFLEEVMMPDVGAAPKIRFEGIGTVLTEPPRPRRRASDLARPSDADRRA